MNTATLVDFAESHTHDLDVVLLWGRKSGRLWVEVTRRSDGRTAFIQAAPEKALDVFHHPFAYAANAA
jgi:hypothetical protein